jgi:ubiquitin-protein ligase
MTEKRWLDEKNLMAENFPSWEYFFDPDTGVFGFQGYLFSSFTGRIHEVVLESNENTYPAYQPKIYVFPPMRHHVHADGTACIPKKWDPRFNSFASVLMSVTKYMRWPKNVGE